MQAAAQALTPDLLALSASGEGPFALSLGDGKMLECERIVRRVPGSRLVCQGSWQGRGVFAKIFLGERAERHAARDRQGVQWLVERNILTPALLHAAPLRDGAGQILLYEAIPHCSNAEEYLHAIAADDGARLVLMIALVRVVAALHQAGLMQTDLYLKNFLLQGDRIYTLDGDGIRQCRRALRPGAALANLALLLSKFDVVDDVYIPHALQAYADARGWKADAGMLDLLKCRAWAYRCRVAQRYAMRKVLRNCTDVRAERSFARFLAVARARQSPDLQQMIDHPDAWLDSADCRRLKNGNTCTVGLVASGERKIVIKRYNIKSFWHGLNRALRKTRAAVSWSNAHLLGMYGVSTARPLALIESRFGPIRRASYFLAEWVDGPDIAEVFADATMTEDGRREVARRMVGLLHKLYLLGIEHGDMKATNIKIVGCDPWLLDLDGMRQHRLGWWFGRRHARDLRRFLKNWHNAPEIRAVLVSALREIYGNDPVLQYAGITE